MQIIPYLGNAAPMELGSRFGGETINITLLTELRAKENSEPNDRQHNDAEGSSAVQAP